MESKRNKTFAMIFLGPEDIHRAWRSSQKIVEESTSHRGAPPSLWAPREPSNPILWPINSQIFPNQQKRQRKTIPAAASSRNTRFHLGAFSGDLLEGDSITEGLHINSMAPPMMREQFISELRVHSQQLDGFFSLSLILSTMFSSMFLEIYPM